MGDGTGDIQIVHTSVCDGGYVVTLEEAAAAPEKLAISYTVQREDGRSMTYEYENEFYLGVETCFDVDHRLLINGADAVQSVSSAGCFLNEEETMIGGQITYDIIGADLAGENTYDLKFSNEKGTWAFKFQADGSQLCTDTKRMALGNSYRLPNGSELTLDELSVNALEQRILFHTSKEEDLYSYAVKLHVTDERGQTAVFYPAGSGDGAHWVMNAEKNKSILSDAKRVTVTLYAVKFGDGTETKDGKISKGIEEFIVPPVYAESGKASDDGKQDAKQTNGLETDRDEMASNTVVWDLTDLR